MATKTNGNQNFIPVDNSERLKKQIEVAATASLYTALHMIVIGDPGFGKTSLLNYISKQVFGKAWKRFTGAPSWTGEEVIGRANPMYLLSKNPDKDGVPYWLFKESFLDSRFEHVFLSELPRTSEIALDWLVHVMDDLPVEIDGMVVKEGGLNSKTVWADGNWWTATFRNAAISDRFSMWLWYTDSVTNAESIMTKPPISTWTFDVPTIERISQVRTWCQEWMNDPTAHKKTFNAVLEPVNEIIRILPSTQFSANNRRVRQWQSILYTMGAAAADSPTFSSLPKEAFEAMTYAYPLRTPVEATLWRSVVSSVVDVEATQIATYEAEAYQLWKGTYASIRRETRDLRERQDRVTQEIAPQFAKAQKELTTRWSGNAASADAVSRLQSLYFKMFRGEDIE